jgi:DNA polymerase-3 subunit delta'
MQFSEILGQEHIKSHLTKAPICRIPHAQLFVGPEEAVRYLWRSPMRNTHLCGNQNGENNGTNQSCKFKKYHIPIYTLFTLL